MRLSKSYYYRIAEFNIKIIFSNCKYNDEFIIPSFKNFRTACDIDSDEVLLELLVDDNIKPYDNINLEHIGDFNTGNGYTSVDYLKDGFGYQYKIRNIAGKFCCLLQTNKNFTYGKCALSGNFSMRNFGLNNALLLIFAFNASYHNTLLIHASLVRHNKYGYAFIAKSGTGKSTHVGLWLQHIKGCDLMNDDNPIIRIINNKAYIYGSPWSGKTPCYRPTKAKLGAITRIDRATDNSIVKLKPTEALTSLIPACSSMKWDKFIFNNICNTIIKLIENTNIFTLHCLPNKDAAIICHKAVSK